jgi:hypothetical protein
VARRLTRVIKFSPLFHHNRTDKKEKLNKENLYFTLNKLSLGENMKFKYYVILIAVASLSVLYAMSLFSHPIRIALAALPAYDGQQVLVQGIVTDYRTTAFGTQLITIRNRENTTHTVTIYIEGSVPIEYGDTIQAVGEVQQYNDQWEISVNNPQFITILQKWANQSFPLWQLAENPENYLETNVNVTGIVLQTLDSSCVLTDSTGKYSIDVLYDSSCPHQISKGDSVAAAGCFVYGPSTMQYLLRITEPSHGIWKIERFKDA